MKTHSTCPADSRPASRPHHRPADPAQQSTDPTRGVSGRFPSGPSGRSVAWRRFPDLHGDQPAGQRGKGEGVPDRTAPVVASRVAW